MRTCTPTKTLASAMRMLAASAAVGGVPNAEIAEAADRLDELELMVARVKRYEGALRLIRIFADSDGETDEPRDKAMADIAGIARHAVLGG